MSHEDAAVNAAHAALLGAAVAAGDAGLLGAAFSDRLHEQYRLDDAPLLRTLREQPPADAAGVTLSGSGSFRRRLGRARPGRGGGAGAGVVAAGRHHGADPARRERGSAGRMNLYGKSHPAKRHSAALTDGVDRAPARAMLKGVGFTDDDLARPLVGVATTWIETMPCNLNHRLLAGYVKQGIRRAGGTPLEFNTIAISDGVSMGTAGMRASLVSREVIADSIELVARGHLFDGLVCVVGCDKTIPAAVMALARLDLPGLVLYGGSIAAGRYRGRDVTIQDVFEVVGARAAGTATDADVHALESVACPGAGACGGQFTANTMALTLDFLGISAPGLNEIPATHPGKPAAAVSAGELAMKLVEEDRRPSQVLTREAFENAIAAIAATGGSTNGVLHLLAIAAEAGVELSIDDFDEIAARTPIVADIKPGGRYVATDLYRAGGVALVARELVRAGIVNDDAAGVDGRSLRQVADGARRAARAGRRRLVGPAAEAERRVGDPARQPRPGRLRRQARRPRAAPSSRPGARLRLRGGLLRRRQGPVDQGRRRRRDPLRGPRGRAGDARDAARDGCARGRGARRRDRADHRRSLLRCDARADGRPRGP